MHFLMYRFKRAHLQSLAVARKLAQDLDGLTPARFDLMRAVTITGRSQQMQSTLWKALGISRTTASKMVRRLIELGLVRRRRSDDDRRTFVVALTEAGDEAFYRALRYLSKYQPLRRAYALAFGNDIPTSELAVLNLDWAVDRTARFFKDTSWNLYLSRSLAAEEHIDGGLEDD